MSAADFYALLGIGLFAMGLYRLVAGIEAVQRILSLNVMGVGVFMVLIATAVGQPPDPVPHAMVLTGIVVAVSATAFALALTLATERAS